MNIDNLTFGQLKEIASLFQGYKTETQTSSRFIGEYVIVRSKDSGVHAGKLESVEGTKVTLSRSRRLWYWYCNKGHSLTGVALSGLKEGECKIAGTLDYIEVFDVCEIIQVSEKAKKSIIGYPEHEQD